MKLLIVLCAVVACSLAAIVPQYARIATLEESLKVAQLTSRIANGHAAATNQFPHQVAVQSPVGAGATTCGGSVISQFWVLTAAHCTVGRTQFNLRFGSLSLVAGGIAQTSFHAINHQAFNPTTLNNDVSLVSIPSALPLSAAIAVVRLPTASQFGTTFLDWQSIISGWGETAPGTGAQILMRWVHTRVISNAQCAGVYGTNVIVAHVVCTLGWTTPSNQGACGGDSGGPLVISEFGVTTQIGIAAFAAATGCNIGLPNGFMRTASFVTWINGHTGIAIRP